MEKKKYVGLLNFRLLIFLISLLIFNFVVLVSAQDCVDECSPLFSTKCLDNKTGYYICGDPDADDCLEWADEIMCGEGEICEEGECVVEANETQNCTSECNVLSDTKCSADNTSYLICLDTNEDGCLEWANETVCGEKEVCEDGECVSSEPEPQPEPEPEDENEYQFGGRMGGDSEDDSKDDADKPGLAEKIIAKITGQEPGQISTTAKAIFYSIVSFLSLAIIIIAILIFKAIKKRNQPLKQEQTSISLKTDQTDQQNPTLNKL